MLGHPAIDNSFGPCELFPKESALHLMHVLPLVDPVEKGVIKLSSVTGVHIEDATKIEKRVTLGRIFLVGIWALAWQKEKKTEVSYLVIEWTDGGILNETVFQFSEVDTVNRANTARNRILVLIKMDDSN